ncbi:response regulator [Sphingobacterium siyangense]|uniref:Response regulator receiver domain-containing protein n=1 Tax=Sphingobacterium siyangense TaxID=459529 RepID=A0A562MK58_9SPHI|nr:response regulator transcription factor [Sphingobacterium siyangense]TWI20309.1 response regulator receiver domain-containing protein [Sphingobacterium siyangense]
MNKNNTIRIALIDDRDLLRKGIFGFLGDFGFQYTFEAANGKEALDKMKTCKILPDICVVDVNMPVMNGFETAEKLKQLYPGVKILAFSVNDAEKDVLEMLKRGVDGYILKGADPEELERAVHVIYAGGEYYSVAIKAIVEKFRKQHKKG